MLTDRLESVQRFVVKLRTKHWSDSSPQLLSSLNWPSLLSYQAEKAQLCRRIIRSKSIIQPHSYCPILTPVSITHVQFQFRLHAPPLFCLPFLCQLASYGIAFLTLWSSSPESPRSFKAALLQLPSLSN